MLGCQHTAALACRNNHPLERVFELAYVAGPVVFKKRDPNGGSEQRGLPSSKLAEPFHDHSNELSEICLTAASKRRHSHFINPEAVVQIWTKTPSLLLEFQVGVGRR